MSTDITGSAAPKEATAVTEAVQNQVQPQETKAVDPKLEQYAKRERQLLKMAREIKQREQAMQQKEQEWSKQRGDYETNYVPKSRFKEDTLSVLNENGVSYDALTQQLLNSPTFNDPVIKSLKGEIAELKSLLTKNSEQAQDMTKQQYEQAKKQIDYDVKLMVDGDEKYEMIKATGAQDQVTEYILQHFNETGFVIDNDVAAQAVEDYLIKEAETLARLKKVQSRLQASEAPKAPVSAAPTQKSQTLTNAVSVQNRPRALTAKERIERAKLAFAGQLK